MRRAAKVGTLHQSLEIWKSDRATEFRVAGAIHAFHHRDRFLSGLAWDLIAAAALLRPAGPPASILMLGLAGGTAFRILRHLLPECQLTAVEIDEEIIDLAREHMDLASIGIEIHLADAYTWLAENPGRFDVVIDDIYLAGQLDVFRPGAMDPAWLDSLRGVLAPDGLVAVNLVTGQGHRGMQSRVRQLMGDAFPTVRSLKTPVAMNEVLVGGMNSAGAARVQTYGAAFPSWRDRKHWEGITVRKLA